MQTLIAGAWLARILWPDESPMGKRVTVNGGAAYLVSKAMK